MVAVAVEGEVAAIVVVEDHVLNRRGQTFILIANNLAHLSTNSTNSTYGGRGRAIPYVIVIQ